MHRRPTMRTMLVVAMAAMLGSEVEAEEPSRSRSISVLTMNLQNPMLPGEPEARARLVAAFIRTRQPDLVALQEVTERRGEENRAAFLARETGYQWAWRPTHRAGGYDEGIAVLSRYPIEWSAVHDLPKVELFGLRRAVLQVHVQHPAGPVELYATHLAAFTTARRQEEQVLDLLEWIGPRSGPPRFLAGDMNAEPESRAMTRLAGTLTDSWPASLHVGEGGTYPSSGPKRRIDAIYYANGAAMAVESARCEVVLGDEVDGRRASDHCGVLCTYLLRDLSLSKSASGP